MTSFNPRVTNGLSHPYHFNKSTFILKDNRGNFFVFISFFDENHVSKQNSPIWDTAKRGVTSRAIPFAFVL